MSIDTVRTKTPNVWWVALVCGLASFIDAATLVANGIALVIFQMGKVITPDQFGILSGVLTFGVAVGAVVGGKLGDAFGRRTVFLCTMVMILVGLALLALSMSFPLLLLGVILAGLGVGADLPVSLATIAESSSDAERGKLIGFSNVLWLVGILAVVIMAIIVGKPEFGMLGGQLMYGMVAAVALFTLIARWSIPESPVWLAARAERKAGVRTERADHATLGDLLKVPYAKPFIALIFFYALTNLGANTGGQFTTYLWVNVLHTDPSFANQITLLMFPMGFVGGYWFMRIVDTPKRWVYFLIGAVAMVCQYLVPAIFGFSLPTMLIAMFLSAFGGSFAFEGIMKVWTQESFPTLLRTTAQGTILAVARFAAGCLAIVTPGLISAGPQNLYFGLAAVCALGLGCAALGFRGQTRNEFDVEDQLEDVAA